MCRFRGHFAPRLFLLRFSFFDRNSTARIRMALKAPHSPVSVDEKNHRNSFTWSRGWCEFPHAREYLFFMNSLIFSFWFSTILIILSKRRCDAMLLTIHSRKRSRFLSRAPFESFKTVYEIRLKNILKFKFLESFLKHRPNRLWQRWLPLLAEQRDWFLNNRHNEDTRTFLLSYTINGSNFYHLENFYHLGKVEPESVLVWSYNRV